MANIDKLVFNNPIMGKEVMKDNQLRGHLLDNWDQ